MGSSDAVSQSVSMMRERGIDNPDELLSFAAPDRIIATCLWWDAKPGAGSGVLANTIRRGGMPEQVSRSSLDAQEIYGQQIVEWLRRHFPEWNRDEGSGTHPAAIAAVIRLHHEHGKGNLTAREHGPQIHAAVKDFTTRWGAIT